MKAAAKNRRDRVRTMLADLKMPGALEAVDGILAQADSGGATASEAIEQLLNAQIVLRNNRRLQTAMRSSRLPAVKTLAEFDFAFQPSIKREQIESLHELGFVDRAENVVLLGPTDPVSQCTPRYVTIFPGFSGADRLLLHQDRRRWWRCRSPGRRQRSPKVPLCRLDVRESLPAGSDEESSFC